MQIHVYVQDRLPVTSLDGKNPISKDELKKDLAERVVEGEKKVSEFRGPDKNFQPLIETHRQLEGDTFAFVRFSRILRLCCSPFT